MRGASVLAGAALAVRALRVHAFAWTYESPHTRKPASPTISGAPAGLVFRYRSCSAITA